VPDPAGLLTTQGTPKGSGLPGALQSVPALFRISHLIHSGRETEIIL